MAFASLADELAGAMDVGGGPGSLADEFGLDDLDLDGADGPGGGSVLPLLPPSAASGSCSVLEAPAQSESERSNWCEDGVSTSSYKTPQQPLHPLPETTPSPQQPPSAGLARNTNTRNGLPLPFALARPSPSISPAQTRTGKSSTSSYHTAQSSAHAELDEAFDLSMEMGSGMGPGLGLGLGLAGELDPAGQTAFGSGNWNGNQHEHETANGLRAASAGLGFTDGQDGEREDVALNSRLDHLEGTMDGQYIPHGGGVRPSWMDPKIDKDPIVILQDCLGASSRLLASLRSTDEERAKGSLVPRPDVTAGQRGSVLGGSGRDGSGGSDDASTRPAWDVEEALRVHLHKLQDAERVREEQLREIVAMGREWAGINWAQGEISQQGWWEREEREEREGLEKEKGKGERADDVGWIGDPQASPTGATATATIANDPIGHGHGQPVSSSPTTDRRLSLEDHLLEDIRGGRGHPTRSEVDAEAEKDPHAALDELLSPADELDELLLAPISPTQSSRPTLHHALHQDQHQTQHQTQHHPRPSSPSPSVLAPNPTLRLNLPNQVHQLITDNPLPALHHLSESLHTATSHATSLSRTIRGIRAGIEHYRERDALEEDARRGIEQWEARRVERGLRGEGGVRALLDVSLFGLSVGPEVWRWQVQQVVADVAGGAGRNRFSAAHRATADIDALRTLMTARLMHDPDERLKTYEAPPPHDHPSLRARIH
ncbi:hypothetical protein EHS25_009797 [Saitozyma podzolica]|uniref:Uncharacterized protein n=1 Tax=Saitozyma podzolica TaxID=1890683 RepID=A0A427YK71_9TREE|nr:hypothetical protein EHS25_009797 [Saitozyma podzolica]